MLVGAARTREPRPSAPVMTARAAVGLRFRPVRLGCIAICPSPTTYTNRDAHLPRMGRSEATCLDKSEVACGQKRSRSIWCRSKGKISVQGVMGCKSVTEVED